MTTLITAEKEASLSKSFYVYTPEGEKGLKLQKCWPTLSGLEAVHSKNLHSNAFTFSW